MNRYRMMAGMVLFGSVWGLLECTVGSVQLSGMWTQFPMGALMGGMFGLGLMAWTRRVWAVPGMQLGMALIAGALRYIAPIGTCLICSAIAITVEGLAFELILLSPLYAPHIRKIRAPSALVSLGVITGYSIYVLGYIASQIMTPIAAGQAFIMDDLVNVLPLILGRGFFAGVFGGIALPIATLALVPRFHIDRLLKEHYYPTSAILTTVCWCAVVLIYI